MKKSEISRHFYSLVICFFLSTQLQQYKVTTLDKIKGDCTNTIMNNNNNNKGNTNVSNKYESSHKKHQGMIATSSKEYNVILFRRTNSRGWEVYFPNGKTEDSNSKKKRGKTNNNNNNNTCGTINHQQCISVTPKLGCIEMKQLRLRVPLMCSTATGATSATTATTSSKSATNVTRRLDTILLTTTRGGCIVFKFTSLEDCISFWDELVLLNANNSAEKTTDTIIDTNSRNNIKNSSSNNTNYKSEEFRSMIVRLLHEDEFMEFVNELEDCLTGTSDGATMLQNAAMERHKNYASSNSSD